MFCWADVSCNTVAQICPETVNVAIHDALLPFIFPTVSEAQWIGLRRTFGLSMIFRAHPWLGFDGATAAVPLYENIVSPAPQLHAVSATTSHLLTGGLALPFYEFQAPKVAIMRDHSVTLFLDAWERVSNASSSSPPMRSSVCAVSAGPTEEARLKSYTQRGTATCLANNFRLDKIVHASPKHTAHVTRACWWLVQCPLRVMWNTCTWPRDSLQHHTEFSAVVTKQGGNLCGGPIVAIRESAPDVKTHLHYVVHQEQDYRKVTLSTGWNFETRKPTQNLKWAGHAHSWDTVNRLLHLSYEMTTRKIASWRQCRAKIIDIGV